MNYDPEKFLASLTPEQRKEYDRLTERVNEVERRRAQAAPGQPIPPDKEPEEPETPPEG